VPIRDVVGAPRVIYFSVQQEKQERTIGWGRIGHILR
jgi:hypothetical protein